MRSYKHITFAEGISCTLGEFKKDFAPHLKKLSEAEIKEAYKAATKGNVKKVEKSTTKKDELSNSPAKGKKANATKDKQ